MLQARKGSHVSLALEKVLDMWIVHSKYCTICPLEPTSCTDASASSRLRTAVSARQVCPRCYPCQAVKNESAVHIMTCQFA